MGLESRNPDSTFQAIPILMPSASNKNCPGELQSQDLDALPPSGGSNSELQAERQGGGKWASFHLVRRSLQAKSLLLPLLQNLINSSN